MKEKKEQKSMKLKTYIKKQKNKRLDLWKNKNMDKPGNKQRQKRAHTDNISNERKKKKTSLQTQQTFQGQ